MNRLNGLADTSTTDLIALKGFYRQYLLKNSTSGQNAYNTDKSLFSQVTQNIRLKKKFRISIPDAKFILYQCRSNKLLIGGPAT